MKVFLTGGTGFLGPHVIRVLKEANIELIAFSRPDSRRLYILEDAGIPIVKGDLWKKETYMDALLGCDAVVHLAGLVKARHPQEFYKVNTQLTDHLARVAIENGIPNFIYISSLAAAGPSPGPYPRPADLPENPVTHYGLSKLQAEDKLKQFSDKIRVIILRPTIIYGEGDRAVLKIFQLANKIGRLPVVDPEQILTYVHAEDVANVIKLTLLKPPSSGTILPVEDGNMYSWQDLANILSEVLQRPIRVTKIPRLVFDLYTGISELTAKAKGKAPIMGLDKRKEALQRYWIQGIEPLKRILNYTPQIDLKLGIKRHIDWARTKGLI